jgi:hypothetical protein
MALRHFDDFAWYTKAQLARAYTLVEAGTIALGPFGRAGGPGVRFSGNADDQITCERFVDAPSGGVAVLAVDFQVASWPGSTTPFLLIYDGATLQVSLDLRSDGKLEAFRGSGGGRTSLGAASTYVVPLSTYIYIAVKPSIHATAGAVVVHVWAAGDLVAQVVLNLSGLDTLESAAAQWNKAAIGAATTSFTDFCNLRIFDGTGTRNFDLPGPQNVVDVGPVSNGALTQFNRSSGVSQSAPIDDVTADDDVSFNYAEVENRTDTLEVGDTPLPDSTIAGVALALVAKGDSGDERLAHVTRQASGALSIGPEVTPTDAYLAYLKVFETLADGAELTAIGFNAEQYGYTWPASGEGLAAPAPSTEPVLIGVRGARGVRNPGALRA